MKVQIDSDAFMPEYAHDTDAGMDIRSPIYGTVPAHGSLVIDSGVHIELPKGHVGMLKSKSGLNVKHDITSEGVIDVDYAGSICVKLYNHGNKDYYVRRGDKITQLVVMPFATVTLEQVEKLEVKGRGENGLGSTGR